MIEQTSIKEIKGVGEKTQKLFEKVGIYTVGDLIRYYPRGYDVYEEAITDFRSGRRAYSDGFRRSLWQSAGVRYEKYAGDNRAYQRLDGDHSSDLVSYAIFKKYIKERSARHPSRQSYKAQESPRNGTPGAFLSAGQIR